MIEKEGSIRRSLFDSIAEFHGFPEGQAREEAISKAIKHVKDVKGVDAVIED